MSRRNLALTIEESWRPPPHVPTATRSGRTLARLRRLLDLQAASIWSDLAQELPSVRGVVADVGSGAQPYRSLLHHSVRYVALDSSDARARFGYEVADTIYFDGVPWPLEDASVDYVLTTETLEHVLDPPAFLAEAARCLRPDGSILLTVPFAARWHYVPYDYWRFTPSSLRHLLEEAGFTEVCVLARGNAVTVAAYKLIALGLPLLLPQRGGAIRRLAARTAGAAALPVVLAAAAVGHGSLLAAGGMDCLGYTAKARRT